MITYLKTAGPFGFNVYNPGKGAVFQVTSTIILEKHEAILIDAQFAGHDAHALAELIRESGRELSVIYIRATGLLFRLGCPAQGFPQRSYSGDSGDNRPYWEYNGQQVTSLGAKARQKRANSNNYAGSRALRWFEIGRRDH